MTTAPAAKSPTFGLLFAIVAFGLGTIAFLIAGFEGHGAGWELLAIPTGLCLGAALIASIGGVIGLTRKAFGGGLATLGVAAFGSVLGLIGFFLGA
ncbi:MAG: hypothetical protein AB7S26_18420 [Sandaracinaceae bacterium]